jgi:hypothetical protein
MPGYFRAQRRIYVRYCPDNTSLDINLDDRAAMLFDARGRSMFPPIADRLP